MKRGSTVTVTVSTALTISSGPALYAGYVAVLTVAAVIVVV